MKLLFACLLFVPLTVSARAGNALSFAGGAVQAHVDWMRGPGSPDESILRVEWTGANRAPVEPGSFRVSLWMPDMAHGSSPTEIQRVIGTDGAPLVGVYDVRKIYFLMGGLWEVRITLKSAGGNETQSFPVEISENILLR